MQLVSKQCVHMELYSMNHAAMHHALSCAACECLQVNHDPPMRVREQQRTTDKSEGEEQRPAGNSEGEQRPPNTDGLLGGRAGR